MQVWGTLAFRRVETNIGPLVETLPTMRPTSQYTPPVPPHRRNNDTTCNNNNNHKNYIQRYDLVVL